MRKSSLSDQSGNHNQTRHATTTSWAQTDAWNILRGSGEPDKDQEQAVRLKAGKYPVRPRSTACSWK